MQEFNTQMEKSFLLRSWEAREKEWQEQKRREEQEQEERCRIYQAIRQREYLQEHSMELFLEKPEGCCYDPSGSIPSSQLYTYYQSWCTEQRITPHPPRSFYLFLKKNCFRYNILYSMNIPTPTGHARGFRGIRQDTEPHA